MRIGVLPAPRPGGGVYQYSLTMLRALGALAESTNLVEQIVVFTDDAAHLRPTLEATGPRWQFALPAPPTAARSLKSHIVRLVGTGRARQTWWRLRQRVARTSRADVFKPLAR